MLAIGVDPGATGAIVALHYDKGVYFCMDYKKLDLKKLRSLLLIADRVTKLAAIERQQYMPKGGRRQGGTSAFSLGVGFGYWRGYFEAIGIETIYPRPREWQRYHFGSGTVISDPKERSIRAAERLLPGLELVPEGCRKPSHGRADAGLIALWALGRMEASRGAPERR